MQKPISAQMENILFLYRIEIRKNEEIQIYLYAIGAKYKEKTPRSDRREIS